MSQIKRIINFEMAVKVAILFCCCSLLTVFFCFTTQFTAPLFLLGIPLFCSYLVVDTNYSNISAFINACVIIILFKHEVFVDIVCNVIFPTILVGNFFVKNLKKGNTTWWFPEIFLLRYFAIFMLLLSLFLSLFYYSENELLSVANNIFDTLKIDDVNSLILKKYLETSIKFSIGLGMLTKMFFVLLNLSVAHRVCIKYKINKRPNFDVLSLSIQNWLAISCMIFFTFGSIFQGISFVCYNVGIVALFAPLINGLSIIHNLSKRNVTIFYASFFLFLWPILIVTILTGMIDSFYPLRKKII